MTTPNTTTDLFIRAQETGTSIESMIQRVVSDELRKQRDELTREFDAKLYDEREQMSIKLDMKLDLMRNEFKAEMAKLTNAVTAMLANSSGPTATPRKGKLPQLHVLPDETTKIKAELFDNRHKIKAQKAAGKTRTGMNNFNLKLTVYNGDNAIGEMFAGMHNPNHKDGRRRLTGIEGDISPARMAGAVAGADKSPVWSHWAAMLPDNQLGFCTPDKMIDFGTGESSKDDWNEDAPIRRWWSQNIVA